MNFDDLSNVDLQNIVKQGANTTFWKFHEHRMEQTKASMAYKLTTMDIKTMEDMVKVIQFNAIYKTIDEIQRRNSDILKDISLSKKEK